ncbi:hypothetical protein BGX28_010300 [Mortierella sp. GBA30]|nr:hypothetical protein BGX28_010300 [Mortierella sp. GBA30]
MGHLFHLKQQDRIGWIGLGQMGFNMAGNLQRYLASRSLTMTVWNRTPAKSAKMHQKHGVHVAKSIEDVVAQSNIIFTSLANDAAIEEIYEILIDLAGQVDHSIIFVETSTIYPTLATQLKERLAPLPQHTYLQCPIFGNPSAAKAAKLIWVTSGDHKAIKKMCLYFTTMSKNIIHLRTTEVAKAASFKLVGNFFVVGTLELLAEGLTMAEKADVDQESVLKFIETFFPVPLWSEYSSKMTPLSTSTSSSRSSSSNGIIKSKVSKKKSKDEGWFSVDQGLKDVGHMRRLAQETGASLPTADLAYDHLQVVKDQGKGDQDWSKMIGALRVSTPSSSSRPSEDSSWRTGGSDDMNMKLDDDEDARPPAYESK